MRIAARRYRQMSDIESDQIGDLFVRFQVLILCAVAIGCGTAAQLTYTAVTRSLRV